MIFCYGCRWLKRWSVVGAVENGHRVAGILTTILADFSRQKQHKINFSLNNGYSLWFICFKSS